ncbi:hypothetical protein PV336_15995 [Streptomyces sp. MI02-2A]|uniref:hypothetical protein n=1 Tax=Streptomyces sp. MI02-2A TaxID=3028688 RepID=UPI0029B7BA2E|nr:hypothetical protein [Streptomyces sp. MI02-2A]MDX3260722.1 hypothetical protein [Streptomyces sp. MI02-2A]
MATVTRRTTRRPERPINLDPESPLEKVRQFLTLKFQEQQIVTRKNLLRDEVSAFVDETGEVDEKGSKFWKLPAPIEVNGQKFTEVKRERRVSTRLDVDAVETLVNEKGLRDRVYKPVTEIRLDQDELYVLNQEGLLTDEEMDSLFTEAESFAFKPLQG